jgi:hypothetical protein
MRSMKQSMARVYPVSRSEVFSEAAQACQQVFGFTSTLRCTSEMLCAVLVWAAAYTGSLFHACQRLFPGVQDQTFWNALRRSFPKRADALERRLTELLQLSWLLPLLHGRWLDLAVDYHAIPYHGLPQKTNASCVATNPNEAPPPFMYMPRCA